MISIFGVRVILAQPKVYVSGVMSLKSPIRTEAKALTQEVED